MNYSQSSANVLNEKKTSAYILQRNAERKVILNFLRLGCVPTYSATDNWIVLKGETFNGWSREDITALKNEYNIRER